MSETTTVQHRLAALRQRITLTEATIRLIGQEAERGALMCDATRTDLAAAALAQVVEMSDDVYWLQKLPASLLAAPCLTDDDRDALAKAGAR